MSLCRVNELSFNVETHGQPGSQALLLLHGFSGSLRSWDHLVPWLAVRAYVIRLDLIGHGRSAAPAEASRYTFEWACRDLEALLDLLGVAHTDVLGYSMGGRLALYFALERPERVRRLLLESASPGIEDAEERARRKRSDAALARRIEDDGVGAFVAYWETQPLLQLSAEVDAALRRRLHEGRLNNRPVGLANSLRGMGAAEQPPLWSRLAHLKPRLALMVGERDERYCAIGRRMHAAVASSTLEICRGAGHTVHLDRPTAFLDWVCQAIS